MICSEDGEMVWTLKNRLGTLWSAVSMGNGLDIVKNRLWLFKAIKQIAVIYLDF